MSIFACTFFFPGEGNKQLPLAMLVFTKYQVIGFLAPPPPPFPPCFPVLSVEFQYVDAEINGTHKQILVSQDSEHVTCPIIVY